MTRAIALVDLDDTLFQTRPKCPADIPEAQLTPLGFARDGAALSFATPRQMSFLNWLAETTHLIAVTGRSRDALARARVPHVGAICAHGGVIIDPEGAPDGVWAARMAASAAAHGEALAGYVASISAAAAASSEPVTARILSEGATPLYVLAKHDRGDPAALARVVEAAVPALPQGWAAHRNGNNAALLPPHLGKAQAVAHMLPGLRARLPDAAVIGIGDSLTDAPFMGLCDFAMLPARSQLGGRLFGEG